MRKFIFFVLCFFIFSPIFAQNVARFKTVKIDTVLLMPNIQPSSSDTFLVYSGDSTYMRQLDMGDLINYDSIIIDSLLYIRYMDTTPSDGWVSIKDTIYINNQSVADGDNDSLYWKPNGDSTGISLWKTRGDTIFIDTSYVPIGVFTVISDTATALRILLKDSLYYSLGATWGVSGWLDKGDTIFIDTTTSVDADYDSLYWNPNSTVTSIVGWKTRGDTISLDTNYIPAGVYIIVSDSVTYIEGVMGDSLYVSFGDVNSSSGWYDNMDTLKIDTTGDVDTDYDSIYFLPTTSFSAEGWLVRGDTLSVDTVDNDTDSIHFAYSSSWGAEKLLTRGDTIFVDTTEYTIDYDSITIDSLIFVGLGSTATTGWHAIRDTLRLDTSYVPSGVYTAISDSVTYLEGVMVDSLYWYPNADITSAQGWKDDKDTIKIDTSYIPGGIYVIVSDSVTYIEGVMGDSLYVSFGDVNSSSGWYDNMDTVKIDTSGVNYWTLSADTLYPTTTTNDVKIVGSSMVFFDETGFHIKRVADSSVLNSNPSFEDWTDMGGGVYAWDSYTVDDAGTGTVEPDSVTVHSGTYSVELIKGIFNVVYIYSSSHQSNDDSMTVSFWYNINANNVAKYYVLRDEDDYYLQANGTWSASYYAFTLGTTSGNWTQIIKKFIINPSNTYFVMWGNTSATALYLDDFYMYDDYKHLEIDGNVNILDTLTMPSLPSLSSDTFLVMKNDTIGYEVNTAVSDDDYDSIYFSPTTTLTPAGWLNRGDTLKIDTTYVPGDVYTIVSDSITYVEGVMGDSIYWYPNSDITSAQGWVDDKDTIKIDTSYIPGGVYAVVSDSITYIEGVMNDSLYVSFGTVQSSSGWYDNMDTLKIDTTGDVDTDYDSIYFLPTTLYSPEGWLIRGDTLSVDTVDNDTDSIYFAYAPSWGAEKLLMRGDTIFVDTTEYTIDYNEIVIDSLLFVELGSVSTTGWHAIKDTLRLDTSYVPGGVYTAISDSVTYIEGVMGDSVYWKPNADSTGVAMWKDDKDTIFIDTSYIPGGVYQIVSDSNLWQYGAGNTSINPKLTNDSVVIGGTTPTDELTVYGNINMATAAYPHGDSILFNDSIGYITYYTYSAAKAEWMDNPDFEDTSGVQTFTYWASANVDVEETVIYSGDFSAKLNSGGMAYLYNNVFIDTSVTLDKKFMFSFWFNNKNKADSLQWLVYSYSGGTYYQLDSSGNVIESSTPVWNKLPAVGDWTQKIMIFDKLLPMWGVVFRNTSLVNNGYIDLCSFSDIDMENVEIGSEGVHIESDNFYVDGVSSFYDPLFLYSVPEASIIEKVLSLSTNDMLVFKDWSDLFEDTIWIRGAGNISAKLYKTPNLSDGHYSISMGKYTAAYGDYSLAGGYADTSYGCPDGYVYNPDSGICVKYDTIDATHYGVEYSVTNGNIADAYGNDGAVIGFGTSGGTGSYASFPGSTSNLWVNRLDTVGVWAFDTMPGGNQLPIGEWIGFTYCLDLDSSATYYIGMAGDNSIRFKIDGELVFEYLALDNGWTPYDHAAFRTWWITQKNLTAGIHVIEMYGLNNADEATLGAEIFTTMDTTSSDNLGIVWNTLEMIGDTFDLGQVSGYSCPPGYAVSICADSVPRCILIDYQSAIPMQSGYVSASGEGAFNYSTINDVGLVGAEADRSAILGGLNHEIGSGSDNSAILGGDGNEVSDSDNGAIIGGADNELNTANYSVILGGNSITGTEDSTVYLPYLRAKENVFMEDVPLGTSDTVLILSNDSVQYRLASGIGGTGGGGMFVEELDSTSSGTLASAASYEFEVDVDSGNFLIDAIDVIADTATTGLTSTFDIEIYQTDNGTLEADDASHNRQSLYNLIYVEEGISIFSTKINNGSKEAAGDSTLTLDASTLMVKYDPLYFNEDGGEWYRVQAVNSATEIQIYDDLAKEKEDNCDVWQAYEKKNLGMYYNQSSATTLYIRITNNSGAARRFTVFTKITKVK